MLLPKLREIYDVMLSKGYFVYESGNKPYQLNIVALRSNSKVSNKFDDWLVVFFKHKDNWYCETFECTTDPGLFYLQNPLHDKGTAIIKEGQYIDSHKLGLHKGKYTALVQAAPVTVIRDFNRDANLDFESGREETGFFGINIHRAKLKGGEISNYEYAYHEVVSGDTLYNISKRYNMQVSDLQQLNNLRDTNIRLGDSLLVSYPTESYGITTEDVSVWSAGCLVLANTKDFNDFISICNKASSKWGNSFTLTVLNEKDFVKS